MYKKINKKGQTMGLAIINAIFIFVVGLMILNFLMPEITQARVDLSCSDTENISDGTKLMCLMTDATVPYWVLLVFSLGIGVITARLSL